MKNYEIEVVDMQVCDWNHEDGCGDYTFSKGGLRDTVNFSIEDSQELSVNDIVEALNDSYVVSKIEADHLNFDEEYFTFSILEDDNGCQDEENGKWLVTYTCFMHLKQEVNFENFM